MLPARHSLRLLLPLAILIFFLGGCGSRQTSPGFNGDVPASAKSAAVVRTARSAVGTPYVWGGCTPEQGFDCSGLIWWAFAENGMTLPRTTDGLRHAGLDTGCATYRQGDVLIFRIDAKGLHAGIYAGDGTFVHSPKSGHTVRVESVRKAYWQNRLLTCRRIAP